MYFLVNFCMSKTPNSEPEDKKEEYNAIHHSPLTYQDLRFIAGVPNALKDKFRRQLLDATMLLGPYKDWTQEQKDNFRRRLFFRDRW